MCVAQLCRGTIELEHSFSVPGPDVQLCVADNVLVALHWSSARALLLDVCSATSDRLQPITSPVQLGSGVRSEPGALTDPREALHPGGRAMAGACTAQGSAQWNWRVKTCRFRGRSDAAARSCASAGAVSVCLNSPPLPPHPHRAARANWLLSLKEEV